MPVNENLRPLTIHVSSAFDGQGVRRHGLFFADLYGRQLCIFRRPLLAAPRVLLAEGVDPETPIATRHAGADFDVDRRRRGWPDRFRGQHALGDLRALQGHFPCGRRSTGAF